MGATEAALGVLHVGSIQQLTKLIGVGLISQYMLPSCPISGSEAAEIGWVTRTMTLPPS